MLGEAAVWRPDKPTPTGEQVLADPRYAMYLAGWPRPGDHGLVAVVTSSTSPPLEDVEISTLGGGTDSVR